MKKDMKSKNISKILILCLFTYIPFVNGKALSDLDGMDKEFLTSLPDAVREDVIKELDQSFEDENEFPRRPSSELSKLDCKEWEELKSQNRKTKKVWLKNF